MPTFKLQAPNPDTNGVKVDGYDRVERNKEDGLFHVHDSNLAAKLQGSPWNFKVASSAPDKAAPVKKATEDKTLDEMTKDELLAWVNERSPDNDKVKPNDFNKADLLTLAKGLEAELAKKNNPQA